METRSGKRHCQSHSAQMRMIVWIIFILGGLALSYYLDKRIWQHLFVFTPYHLLSGLAGLILFQVMRKIAANTGRYLHKHGRQGDLPRFETNVLATGGYYRYMRHPMHQGLMLAPLAVGLLSGSPSFVLFVAPFEILLMYLLIVTVEEKEALRKFGEAYKEFMQKTPRFCFRPVCWKMLISGITGEREPESNN